MMPKNVSDYLVAMLVEADVKHIYPITDSLGTVNDFVLRGGRLQWILMWH